MTRHTARLADGTPIEYDFSPRGGGSVTVGANVANSQTPACGRTLDHVPLSEIGMDGDIREPIEPPPHPVYVVMAWATVLVVGCSVIALAIVGAVLTWRSFT